MASPFFLSRCFFKRGEDPIPVEPGETPVVWAPFRNFLKVSQMGKDPSLFSDITPFTSVGLLRWTKRSLCTEESQVILTLLATHPILVPRLRVWPCRSDAHLWFASQKKLLWGEIRQQGISMKGWDTPGGGRTELNSTKMAAGVPPCSSTQTPPPVAWLCEASWELGAPSSRWQTARRRAWPAPTGSPQVRDSICDTVTNCPPQGRASHLRLCDNTQVLLCLGGVDNGIDI